MESVARNGLKDTAIFFVENMFIVWNLYDEQACGSSLVNGFTAMCMHF